MKVTNGYEACIVLLFFTLSIAITLAFYGLAVWVVVSVLRLMGVL